MLKLQKIDLFQVKKKMPELTLKGKLTLASSCLTIIKQSLIERQVILGPGPQITSKEYWNCNSGKMV